ncbi:Predicted pyridoxal phosphate-dependent enzyme, YBL036C type [Alteracholeplasma palmae J233]|uniref:Predicted pyridoxal phosphate-dependent enzyme, YBL036C type n=2 Tax=Acholeplasma palmae TaxID=38986 RepID=U4KKW4_ALTPJ|nr:Predicted pyridoxal phosphate-dependent enzyme, YBL036C type [Alteracholeplasma palmae J233]
MFDIPCLDNIVCASKYFSVEEIEKIHFLGITNFGENRVSSLLEKKELLSHLNLTWHFIGHLQKNKVKLIINEIDYLHSLDSLELAKQIQKYRISPLFCFIQVNLTEEVSKSGISSNKLASFLEEIKKYDKIKVLGLMTIGKNNDLELTKNVFSKLNDLKNEFQLETLSIGMSQDYHLALPFNPKYIRIGSLFKGVI